jgi:glycosyltransferase involved in cell wall biosynthesis
MSLAEFPIVSIVTPVLNGARFLPETLESVRLQDYPRLEHVVVDGGSTDGTLDLLKAAPGVVWASGPDRGMYDAVGRGFVLARGEVLAYQNADDRYVVPGAVSAAVRYLGAHPGVDVVYGDFRYIDEAGRPLPRSAPGREFDLTALRRHNFVPPHAAFVRRAVVEEGHRPDPSLRFAGDWEWFLGMARAGKRFAHLPQVLAEFRLHRHAQTRIVPWRTKIEEWRRVCARHEASLPQLLWYEGVWGPFRRRLGPKP